MRRGNYFKNLAARFKHGSVAALFITTQLIFVVAASGTTFATGAATLQQCRNGALASPAPCVDSGGSVGWVSGNAGSSNSHWREGDSIPYRILFSGFNAGSTHNVTITYDTTKGGKHALDYLTTFDRTETQAMGDNPCSLINGCNLSSFSKFAIPKDTNITFTNPASSQIPGFFTLYNGSITGISTNPSYALSGSYASDSQTSITIYFTATDSTPVLAWAAHIASQIDWGTGNSASSISGSPYHMILTALDGKSGAAQDRSLDAGAVLPTPSMLTIVSSSSVNVGTSVTDQAILTGISKVVPLSGTVSFYVCGPQVGINSCPTGSGTSVGLPVTVSPGTGSIGTATSQPFQVTLPGSYCFGATYNPDLNASYSPIGETDFSQECFTATIPNSTIEIIKDANPISSQAFSFTTSPNLDATGSFSLTDNGTSGANTKTFSTVAPGTYTVTEQPTSNWDFTSLNCGNSSNVVTNGTTATITITGGQSVVCTYTNTGRGTINVIKNVNDGLGTTTTDASGWNWNLNGTGNYTDGGTAVNEPAGNYSVSEALNATQSADYQVTASSCSDGTTTTNTTPASTTQSVTLAPGENITCYFTNTRDTGTVTVNKVINPISDNGTFNLSINGPTSSTTPDQGSGGTTGAKTVVTGSYNVSETAYTGTNMSDYSSTYLCNNGLQGSGTTTPNFTVSSNQNVVCTFTNTRLATLTIIKNASPYSTQTFGFTTIGNGLPANFSLTDNSAITNTNQQQFTQLAPGNYSVTEDPTTGWSLTDLYCDQNTYTANISTGELNVTLAPGENLACSYTNTELDSISGYKYEVNSNGATVNPLANITIELLVSGSVKQSTTTSSNGSYSFTGLLPGSFTLEELMPTSGWTQIYSPGPVTLVAGVDSTGNNFGNFKNVSISGYKFNDLNGSGVWNSNDPGLPGWTIDLYNSANVELGSQVTGADGSYQFTNLGPDTYKLCEVMQNGWVQTYPGTPTSPACQNVDVTQSGVNQTNINFGNMENDSITLAKTNNRPNPTTVGDTVTYTLTVTVPESSGIVYDATVIDTPPDNFKVDNSTATAQLIRNGLTTILSVPSPNYGSPGTWVLGTLLPGDKVVLTYQATIQSNVSDGIYPDLAYITGYSQPNSSGYEVIGNITNLSNSANTPFVGTLVSIISPLPIGTYTAPRIVGPPELVNTGTNILAAQYILPVLLVGGVVIVLRRNAKTGRGDK